MEVSSNQNKFNCDISAPVQQLLAQWCLKRLKVNVKFTNANPQYSFDTKAKQLEKTAVFKVAKHSDGLNNGYTTFAITVEVSINKMLYFVSFVIMLFTQIDASSLLIFVPNSNANSLNSFTKIMFQQNKLADIQIKPSQGKAIYASKFILSRSPVFDAMLNRHKTKESQLSVIEIKDIDREVLVEMINYMYTDETYKLNEMAVDLLIAANKYDLPGLVIECGNHLKLSIATSNFVDILIAADQLNSADLKNAVINYIIDEHKEALATADWKTFEEYNPKLAIEILKECIKDLEEKKKSDK